MIRARPVTFAGGLLLEGAPGEQKEISARWNGDRRREEDPGAGRGERRSRR